MKVTIFFLLLQVALSCNSLCVQEKESKPNVILILADDLGYSDISCYGAKNVTKDILYASD